MRRYNQGGQVPSVLTGGEFVVNKDSVKNNGSAFMSSVNSGTLNTRSNQATSDQSTNITHGDVNVTINVSGGGGTTSSGGSMNPSEFSAKVKSAVMEVIAKERRVGGSMR
jgi:DeoR/GlpR family transcriptional regulator of sugar metabolism